eukprot:scaffold104454_cov28-Tisochrysis_lutea.AAC.2
MQSGAVIWPAQTGFETRVRGGPCVGGCRHPPGVPGGVSESSSDTPTSYSSRSTPALPTSGPPLRPRRTPFSASPLGPIADAERSASRSAPSVARSADDSASTSAFASSPSSSTSSPSSSRPLTSPIDALSALDKEPWPTAPTKSTASWPAVPLLVEESGASAPSVAATRTPALPRRERAALAPAPSPGTARSESFQKLRERKAWGAGERQGCGSLDGSRRDWHDDAHAGGAVAAARAGATLPLSRAAYRGPPRTLKATRHALATGAPSSWASRCAPY